MQTRGSLIFLLCYVLAVISITSAGQCQEGCTSSKVGKFNYVPGSIYTYSIDSTISFHLTGNDAQETGIKIQGLFQLFVEQNCGYVLRIQRLLVISPDGTKSNLGPEFTKPIRFTLSNDQLSPEICAESNDNEYSLNIKRAIISIIQSADDRGQETDVFGICPTTFNTNTVAGTTIISKVRNLNLCSNRENLASGFITGIVNEHSGVTSTPLLNGDYSSEQRIKDGVLESAIVNEEYIFVPLTAGEAGARAKVVTTVKLTQSGAGQSPKIANPSSESIFFSNPAQTSFSNLNNARTALKNVLAAYEVRVGPNAAKQLTELIRIFRVTNRNDLLALYQQVKAGTISDRKTLTRQIFFDALFRTGSGESVEVLAQFVKSRELSEQELQLVYLSLNLVTKMTKEALNSVNKLLDGNPPKEAYLTVGNLVSKYCGKHLCNAAEIKSIIEKFTSKIVNCKEENRNQADTLVAILKGLRNTNNLVGTGIDRVTACTGAKSSTRVRVAAIQALAAAGYSPNVEQTLLGLLNDREQDSEIRIEAYLTLAAHPTESFAQQLAILLADEPVYQVGSFLMTHIQSSRSSVDPSKSKLRKLYQNIKLEKKYPRDPRKYSFNSELSYAIDSLGAGAIFDTNVIYSQKSYLPRSASFNFTGDVFGQSFNVFEVAARQENLEQIIENYFGPKGYFNTQTSQEIYDKISTIFEKSSGASRNRRGIKEDVQNFARNVDLGRDILRGIDLDVSFKLFGTEMFFLSLGKHTLSTPQQFVDEFITGLGKCLHQAQNYNQVFENHALFLDGELTYPTSIGFPLKLVAQGSSVVRIELGSKADYESIVKNPENAKFSIRAVPSANIYATGSLTLDAFIVNAGIQVGGSVHSSTGIDLEFSTTNNGNGLNLNVKFPFSKQEIISIDHKVVFIQQNKGQETKETSLKFSSQKKEITGCFDQLQPFTGLVLCTEISATIPGVAGVAPFPLNGENKVAISLQVDDEYVFTALYKPEDKIEKVIFSYERPNAPQPNRVEFSLELSYGQAYYIRAGLDFPPYGTHIVEAGVLHANTEFALYVKSSDSREEQIAKIGFLISGDDKRHELKPNVYIKTRNGEYDNIFGYKVDGKVIVETGNQGMKFTFDRIQMIGGEQQPLKMDGYVEWLGNIVNTDLQFSRAAKSGKIVSHLEFTPNPALLNFDVALTTNFDDLLNGKVIFNILSDNTERKFNFEVIYGKDFNSQNNRVSYKSLMKMNPDDSIPEFSEVTLYIGFLPAQAHYKYEVPSPHHFVGEAGAGYGKTKVGGTFDLQVYPNKPYAYNLAASGSYNDYTAKLNSKYDVGSRNKFENKLSLSTGLSTEVNVSFKPLISDNELDFDVEGILILDPKQDQYRVFMNYAGQPKAILSSGKFIIGKTDFMTYDYKFNKLPNQDVLKFDFFVREVLVGKSEFKSVNGKGDGFVLVNFVKAQRKLKSDFKFNIALPVADVAVDVYYDFEKDNSKKFTYTTKNKLTRHSVDSKNTVDCSTSGKYVLNFDFAHKGELDDGTIGGKFTLILPDLHTYTGELNRAVNFVKREQVTGQIDIKLEEKTPNKKTRTLKFNGKVNEGNLNKGLLDITHSIVYNNLESKTLIVENTYRQSPTQNTAYAYKSTLIVKGSSVPETVDVRIDLTEVDKTGSAGLMSFAYGKSLTAGIQGSYHIGDRAVPLTYEFDSYLTVPSGQIKSSTLNSKGSLLIPATESQPYVFNFEVNSKIDKNKLSFKTNSQLGPKSGVLTFDLNVPITEPITGSYKYQQEENDDYTKCFSEYFFKYENDKMIKGDLSIGRTTLNDDITITGNLETPYQHIATVHYDISAKSASNEKYLFVAKVKTNNDKLYVFKLDQNYNPSNSKFDLDVTMPNQDNYRVYYAYKQLAERKYRSEAKIVNILSFNFDGDFEINYSSIDEFYVKANVDSAALKLNEVAFETYTKPSSGGKGILFKVTSNGQNVINGAADFALKDDKFKMVVEGSGTVKLYERQSQVKFDFVRRFYDIQRDGEQGFSVQFTSIIGERNSKNGITSHFKLTDKELIIKDKYCDSNNECVVFDLASRIDRKDLNNLRHDLTAFIDLKAFGLSQALDVKSETKSSRTSIDHNTEIKLTTSNFEYQYYMYVQPRKSGIVLTIPTRVVSIESNYNYPEDALFGKYDFSVTGYTDKKNKPNHKYYLGYEGTYQSLANYQISVKEEARFLYPSLKPLIIRETYTFDFSEHNYVYSGEFDIFQDIANKVTVTGNLRNNKIANGFNVTSNVHAYSKGLELDYSYNDVIAIDFDRKIIQLSYDLQSSIDDILMTGYINVNDRSLEVYNNHLNFRKYSLNAKYDVAKLVLTANSNLEYQGHPHKVTGNLKINGPQLFDLELKQTGIFSYKILWAANKEASYQFYDLTDNKQTELITIKILLGNKNFLTSTYNYNEEGVQALEKRYIEIEVSEGQKLRKRIEDLITRIADLVVQKYYAKVENAIQSYIQVNENFNNEIELIKTEILSDKVLNEIYQRVLKLIEVYGDLVNELITIFTEYYRTVTEQILQSAGSIIDLYSKQIQPALEIYAQQIAQFVYALYKESAHVVRGYVKEAFNILKTYETDLNKFGKVGMDFYRNIAQTITQYTDIVTKELTALYELILKHLHSYPNVEAFIQSFFELIEEYKVKEYVITLSDTIFSVIIESVPTSEAKKFLENLRSYVEAKIQANGHQLPNENDLLKSLYTDFLHTIRAIITIITGKTTSYVNEYGVFDSKYGGLYQPLPFSYDYFKNLPIFSGGIRSSLYNYIKNDEQLLSVRDVLNVIRPRGLKSGDILPPYDMYGLIADGLHIFTFDGQHLTFPGKCQYILAQDFVNNNFSIVGTYNKGSLKSIILIDKNDQIEIQDTGIVLLNGNRADLPIFTDDIFAIRDYYSTTLNTKYGAEVTCSIDLRVCHVTVSGFYLGKVRGILGNGNGEPYDDFKLPNNKISTNSAEFGNAYRVKAACESVSYVDYSAKHDHKTENICDEFFGPNSPLRLCNYFIDKSNYYEACQHAIAISPTQEDAACNIALAYATICVEDQIPITLPSKCAKCANNVEVGDHFSVKVSQKQGDIVLVVDTENTTTITEFIQPFIQDLRKEFKARETTDLRIIVIGYNKHKKHINLFTDKGKLDFNGKLQNYKFNGPNIEQPIHTKDDKFNDFLNQLYHADLELLEELGLSADTRAFELAYKYPFRSAAMKAIITVRNDELESVNILKILSAIITQGEVTDSGISLHLIAPVKDISNTKDVKKSKDIIGFNNKVAVQINEAKKKTNYGSADIRKHLKYEHTLGTELVTESGGFVYSLTAFGDLKQQQKKGFISVASGSIADQLTRFEIQSECVCQLRDGLYPLEVCEVQSKKVLQAKKTGQRG